MKKILKIKNTFLIEDIPKEDSPDAPYLVSGYFKKWGTNNNNGEKYSEDAYDEFINEYFVKNKLHIPINVMHYSDLYHLAGRVVSMEKNTVGIKLTAEIVKSAINFSPITGLIKDKVLQGFSDEGFSTDYEYRYTPDGDFDFCLIKKAALTRISLVDIPSEATAKFEFKNATNFKGFNKKNKLPFLK